MHIAYNILIYTYNLCINIGSFLIPKAKLWVKGREKIFKKIKNLTEVKRNIVWFHCSSLGEFEQGRPIIESYKRKYLNHKILLTFFSPSGYEISKNYSYADWIFYLPIDTPSNAKKFLDIVNPLKAIFIKYDFWFNYMNELGKRNIPLYFVSSIFREDQVFFKYKWCAKQLKNVTHFFVQDKNSEILLRKIGINKVSVSGDSRFDRVRENTENHKSTSLIRNFTKNKKTIISGSTWPKDEKLLIRYIQSNSQYNYVITPHELKYCKKLAKKINGLLLSEANTHNINTKNVLIINSFGLLSTIYKYATISYVGGGFGRGIHNILEPAAFDVPVIFGPSYHKFNEAQDLIELKGAKSIKNINELQEALSYFSSNYKKGTCKNYVLQRCGSTKIIVNSI